MAAGLCILQEGFFSFSGASIFRGNKHRCHSNTDEVPSYFLALAGSIRVSNTLLDVMTTEKGGSCVN